MDTISFTVKPVYVQEGKTSLGYWTLRRFQERVADALRDKKDSILVAPTGSGKTLTLLLADYGAVGVYPNNTLLLDQQRSIHKILINALGAKLVYQSPDTSQDGVPTLSIYEQETRKSKDYSISSYKRIAVIVLSGRRIGYDYDSQGRLIPKRKTILHDIVDNVCYPSRGEDIPYIITLTTPDTALMIMAGIYRDFEKVGYTLHDFLLGLSQGYNIDRILSKYKVAVVDELGDLSDIRQCLLKYPWFIDEFHLYGIYEAYGLLPVLKVYRDYVGWEEPFILSSATPKGTFYELVKQKYKMNEIIETGTDTGSKETLVRGETKVEVVAVNVAGRGVGKWLRLGYYVADITSIKIDEIKQTVSKNGRVFIVVDRVNQVPEIVNVLTSNGIRPECSVSIKPTGCSEKEELVLVGSESISQGIDRENVRYGILSAYNWATLLQRLGRIGRKTSSKVVILVPLLKSGIPLEDLDGQKLSYEEFSAKIIGEFPDIDPFSEKQIMKRVKDLLEARSKLVELMAIIGYAHVSKTRGVIETLAKSNINYIRLLDLFYGPAETLAGVLMFRRSGFPVLVEKPNGEIEEVDVGTVLRNYNVTEADSVIRKGEGVKKRMVKLKTDLKPSRQKLVLEPELFGERYVRIDASKGLIGKITTIGELLKLGYRLVIKPVDGKGAEIEVPITPDVRGQLVTIINTMGLGQLVEFYTYTVTGIEVKVGEHSLVALFI